LAAITLRHVGKSFARTRVIDDVDLDIRDKEFVVFVGPSGCGKSTLLRLIAGLEDLSAGEIRFDDAPVSDLPPAERGIAMVFQSYALYPHMSVFDNMAFGLKLAGGGKAGIAARVHEAARILQLDDLLERKPRQLSGGQRQRVAIGRAIVREPRAFLFDEPLSNLDAALRVQMRVEIARLHRRLDATMVYVTHDQVEAMTLADRIVVLNGGRVEQVGTPLALYHQPCNLFVAGFIGSPRMNFVAGTVVDDAGALAIDLGVETRFAAPPATGLQAGQPVTVGLRPEHLLAGTDGDVRLSGRIVAVEHLGGETYIHVQRAVGEPLLLKCAGDATARVGDPLTFSAPAAACYLFDEAGSSCAGYPPPAPVAGA
jgi:multiple sugar transport system ATP-binding protein